MDVDTKILIQLIGDASVDLDMDVTPRAKADFQYTDDLTDGTGANQADLVWFDDAAMIADATDAIDLAGALTDVFGTAATFVRVKCVFFKNTSTTASVLQVGPHANATPFPCALTSSGGATANEFRSMPAGAGFILWAPDATAHTVGAGATDIFEVFESSSLAATYEVAVVGATA